MNEIKYWIWLSRIKGIGSKNINKLLNKYKTPENIWRLNEKELTKINGIGEIIAKNILNIDYRKNLDKYEGYMLKNNIKLISINDEKYPKKLKEIYDPPICIYVKGNEKILNDFAISIIGCRNCSKYGENISKKLAFSLSNNNINVISGLARGIDTYAHKGCININNLNVEKGKTIAVVGNGLDIIYPKENIEIFNNIIYSGGAIVSEYIIGTKPFKMNFPARNRIISGLSDGVIVVEATEKSGTMITVDFALEHGKNVFAIPGNIDSKNSEGTNRLIKEGAKLVTNINDILSEYNHI